MREFQFEQQLGKWFSLCCWLGQYIDALFWLLSNLLDVLLPLRVLQSDFRILRSHVYLLADHLWLDLLDRCRNINPLNLLSIITCLDFANGSLPELIPPLEVGLVVKGEVAGGGRSLGQEIFDLFVLIRCCDRHKVLVNQTVLSVTDLWLWWLRRCSFKVNLELFDAFGLGQLPVSSCWVLLAIPEIALFGLLRRAVVSLVLSIGVDCMIGGHLGMCRWHFIGISCVTDRGAFHRDYGYLLGVGWLWSALLHLEI